VRERIQKVLANAGVASRRNVEEMVLQGRVTVNGKVVTQLPVLIDPQRDRVAVDGEDVRLGDPRAKRGGGSRDDAGAPPLPPGGPRLYLLMNKPKGVYSTNVAQGEQLRAIDLLPPDLPGRVYPVGRLDAESRGLLLLTNDGELTNRLTHPRYGVAKTYRAVVDGDVRPQTIHDLAKGVWLPDPKGGGGSRTGRTHIKVIKNGRDKSVLEITIREDRNRQVRRVLAKLGHKVRDLMRVRMGALTLHGLAPGQVRALTPREVRELRQLPRRPDAHRGDGHDADRHGADAGDAAPSGRPPRRASGPRPA
jgi:23S rRNA pseudouridine2605 synthase